MLQNNEEIKDFIEEETQETQETQEDLQEYTEEDLKEEMKIFTDLNDFKEVEFKTKEELLAELDNKLISIEGAIFYSNLLILKELEKFNNKGK